MICIFPSLWHLLEVIKIDVSFSFWTVPLMVWLNNKQCIPFIVLSIFLGMVFKTCILQFFLVSPMAMVPYQSKKWWILVPWFFWLSKLSKVIQIYFIIYHLYTVGKLILCRIRIHFHNGGFLILSFAHTHTHHLYTVKTLFQWRNRKKIPEGRDMVFLTEMIQSHFYYLFWH